MDKIPQIALQALLAGIYGGHFYGYFRGNYFFRKQRKFPELNDAVASGEL